MSPERLNYLIDRFFSDTCTKEERQELASVIDHPADSDEPLRTALEKAWMQHEPGDLLMPDEMSGRILQSLNLPGHAVELGPRPVALPVRPRLTFLRGNKKWWMAAAAALLVGSGLYLLAPLSRNAAAPIAGKRAVPVDFAPGGNRASLTLGNGQKIMLDSANNGILAKQGSSTITKLSNGQLAYTTTNATSGSSAVPGSSVDPAAPLYNTMSTPAGGKYELTLPDGSRVWLNASSSITYPVAFAGNERQVEITGEAYFEVTKIKAMPFRVVARNTSVYVLGTSFNINAYSDENNISTTLVEGAVKIGSDKQQRVLAPGQQGRINADGNIDWITHADVEQAVAWKNGIFSFHDADIRTLMRQLSRWYDVEVTYEGAMPTGDFSGEIGRGLTLTQVLNGLSQEKVHYKIVEGNKIVILP
jgi:transmembrane sensor